jgi:hypothetical protein
VAVEVKIERWDDDRSEYRPVPLSRVRYNGEAAVVAGRIRIVVNREVVWEWRPSK